MLATVAITALLALTVAKLAHARQQGRPQPARIASVARRVFGTRWRVAACVAHYESTDGAWLYNGSNLGPWQINVAAHPWVNPRRVVSDWLYAARCAYLISGRRSLIGTGSRTATWRTSSTSGRAASTSKSAVTATWSTTSRISRFALLLHVRCEGWEQER